METGPADTIRSAPGAAPRRTWRIGVFDLYLLRGISGSFALILFAVMVALLLERALRLIHELAGRGADLGYFLPLLGRLLPYYFELALPLAFLVALVMLVARLDQRLELEAFMASGLSLARIAAPLVGFGFLLAGLALLAGGWLEPLGRYGFRALRTEADNAGRIGGLQPQAIFEPHQGLVVTFDRRLPDGSAGGVFLWQKLEDGQELVVSGARGQLGFWPAQKRLGVNVSSGRYISQLAGEPPTTFDFGQLALREELAQADAEWERGWDQKELTLGELAQEWQTGARALPRRAVEAEFLGRIARAAVLPLVPLLVLPLAIATKRRGRALGVLLSAGLLVLATHGLNFARNLALLGGGDPLAIVGGSLALAWLLAIALFASGRQLPSHSPIHSLFEHLRRLALRVLPETRGSAGLRARSLGSYVALQIGLWTLLSLTTCAVFLLAIDLINQGDEFFERGFGLAQIALYAQLRLSAILQQAIPIAALAGAMAGFSVLTARHEMTAIRAGGVSQWRLLAMAAPVALALAASSFALAEWVTPASQLRLATWWDAAEPTDRDQSRQPRWFRIGDAIVQAESMKAGGRELAGLRIYTRAPDGRVGERISARAATYANGAWTLRDAVTARFSPTGSTLLEHPTLAWSNDLRPVDLVAFFARKPALTADSASRSLSEAAPASLGESVFATRIHRSYAEPLAPLAMLLFALPLAFLPPRNARSWLALAAAGAAGLAYLVLDGIFTVSAQVGYISPWIGAWVAPVLGGLVGLEVLVKSER